MIKPSLLLALVLAACLGLPASARPEAGAVAPGIDPAYADSVRFYREALARDASSREARKGLARSLAFSGRAEESLPVFGALLAADSSDTEARLARARALAWLSRFPEAMADAQWATTQAPANAEARWTLGDILLWSGRPASALEAYDSCLALDPGFREAAAGRQKAEAALRDQEERSSQGEADAESKPVYATSGFPWRIGAEFSGQALLDGRLRQNFALSLRRSVGAGYVNMETGAGKRYGPWEKLHALEGYFTTWKGSYVNLRVQIAPQAVYLPVLDYHGEVFQGFLSRFEASVRFRQMVYGNAAAEILGAGAAVYLGPWYARGSTSVTLESAPSRSYSFLTRRYLGNPDEFGELRAGFGKSEKTWKLGGENGYFASARAQSLIWKHLGGTLGAQYGKEAGLGRFWELSAGAFMGF